MKITGRVSDIVRSCRVIRRGSDARIVVSHADCTHEVHD